MSYPKYYKGQQKCPYDARDIRSTAWKIEYVISKSLDKKDFDIGPSITEYFEAGLRDYKKDDDIPLFVKALIFNRFCEYEGQIDVGKFKRFYEQIYS